jgi:hypothetical protein
MVPKFPASIPAAKRRWILHMVGVVILLAGYSSAILLWRAQDRIDQKNADLIGNEAAPLRTLDSKKDSRQVEVYYGKTGLLLERWTEWAESLTHGRPLAKVLIVFSSAVAIGCFLVAGRMAS